MDMVGVSTPQKLISQFTNWFMRIKSNICLFVQNVLPQIFDEGATDDKGEMARMVSNSNIAANMALHGYY